MHAARIKSALGSGADTLPYEALQQEQEQVLRCNWQPVSGDSSRRSSSDAAGPASLWQTMQAIQSTLRPAEQLAESSLQALCHMAVLERCGSVPPNWHDLVINAQAQHVRAQEAAAMLRQRLRLLQDSALALLSSTCGTNSGADGQYQHQGPQPCHLSINSSNSDPVLVKGQGTVQVLGSLQQQQQQQQQSLTNASARHYWASAATAAAAVSVDTGVAPLELDILARAGSLSSDQHALHVATAAFAPAPTKSGDILPVLGKAHSAGTAAPGASPTAAAAWTLGTTVYDDRVFDVEVPPPMLPPDLLEDVPRFSGTALASAWKNYSCPGVEPATALGCENMPTNPVAQQLTSTADYINWYAQQQQQQQQKASLPSPFGVPLMSAARTHQGTSGLLSTLGLLHPSQVAGHQAVMGCQQAAGQQTAGTLLEMCAPELSATAPAHMNAPLSRLPTRPAVAALPKGKTLCGLFGSSSSSGSGGNSRVGSGARLNASHEVLECHATCHVNALPVPHKQQEYGQPLPPGGLSDAPPKEQRRDQDPRPRLVDQNKVGLKVAARQQGMPPLPQHHIQLKKPPGGSKHSASAKAEGSQAQRAPTSRLFIGNIGWWVDEALLADCFKGFGAILDIQVMWNTKMLARGKRINREFAFISYSTPLEAARAVQCMHGCRMESLQKDNNGLTVEYENGESH